MRDQDILNAEEIARLLYKEMHDDLTKEERLRLNQWQWSQDKTNRKFIDKMTEGHRLAKDLQTFDSFDPKAALKDVQRRIAKEEKVETSRPVPSLNYFRKRTIIGGAVIVALFTTVGILYIGSLHKSRVIENPAAQAVVSNTIIPGGNKAVLTLADGRQIALDNAGNGQLARQGSSQVMKLSNGQIAYQTSGDHQSVSNQTSYNIISTPRGGQYQVLLPDGSRVWLNAASSLRFPTSFTGKERRVILTGEAFFQVHSDLSVPFKVSITPSPSSGGGGAGAFHQSPLEVDVLGTEFNVKAYADEEDIRTTLVNGSVKVQSDNQASILKPGQQARVANVNSASIQIVSDAALDEVTAWKEDYFLFQSASLESVMNQLARWYDVQVKYEGAKPTQLLTAHVSRKNNLSDILSVLEISGYHFEISGRTVVVKN
jgi:transmembrane sensor